MLNREGINIFLAGFVPTENLRFREESLSFKVVEAGLEEEVKKFARYSYPNMTKTQGGFTLSVRGMERRSSLPHDCMTIMQVTVLFDDNFLPPTGRGW